MPRKIAHINLNAKDFDASLAFFTGALGFRLIDDNAPLWFLHCNNSDHSSIVLAKTNQPTLNHVAFEMPEIESVMRGMGRMKDAGYPIEWGPGRHGPGDNVFAYFCGPDEVPLEYTAEVLQVDDSYQPRPSSILEIRAGPLRSMGHHATALGALLSGAAAVRLHRGRPSPSLSAAQYCFRMLWSPSNKNNCQGEITVRRSLPAIALAFVCAAFSAQAQDYPTRPIRALTTASAGGISDVFMRALGDKLGARLGQPIVVENRPGGMQNVGARACQDAAPDGYTICIINADPIIYNQFLIKDMPFDPVHGLQPITDLFDLIHTLVVNSNLKVKNIDELIALSKERAGTLSYVTPGAPMVLYMETLKKQRGADWVRVPFKGGGEAVNAVLGGSTPIALIGEGNVIGQIRAGTMTPLVMMNNIHSPNFPNVPTLKETGYNGPPSRGWYGLFAPAGTPRPIVDRIAKEVAVIVADPDFAEKQLKERSLVGSTDTPDEFAKQIVEDRVVAEQVVKQAGMGPE